MISKLQILNSKDHLNGVNNSVEWTCSDVCFGVNVGFGLRIY